MPLWPPMHPARLRRSSHTYSRYARSSRLAGRAPQRPEVAHLFPPGSLDKAPEEKTLESLAARGESPAAFERRCIPPSCVASLSNTAGMLPRRAFPDGRIATLGATRDFHHGLLGCSPGPIEPTGTTESVSRRALGSAARGEVPLHSTRRSISRRDAGHCPTGHDLPVFSLVTPCQSGAAPVSVRRGTSDCETRPAQPVSWRSTYSSTAAWSPASTCSN